MIENPASANLPYELTTMVVICTLSGHEPRDGGIDETSHYRLSLVAGSSVAGSSVG
jgi:hypothetical protein